MADDKFGLGCIIFGGIGAVFFYCLASQGSFGDLTYVRDTLLTFSVGAFVVFLIGIPIIIFNHIPVQKIFENKEKL
jgi:uncharacterized membrane protein